MLTAHWLLCDTVYPSFLKRTRDKCISAPAIPTRWGGTHLTKQFIQGNAECFDSLAAPGWCTTNLQLRHSQPTSWQTVNQPDTHAARHRTDTVGSVKQQDGRWRGHMDHVSHAPSKELTLLLLHLQLQSVAAAHAPAAHKPSCVTDRDKRTNTAVRSHTTTSQPMCSCTKG